MISFEIYDKDSARYERYEQLLKDDIPVLYTLGSSDDREKYGSRLGWFNVWEWADNKDLDHLTEIAERVRSNADVFVVIGVGGSNNAARSVIRAFPETEGPDIIFAGNSLSPRAMNRVMKEIEGKSVYIECIAQNFETLEPGSAFRMLRAYMYDVYGEEAAERIIAVGSRGSLLQEMCSTNGYTFVEFPWNVGGRFTGLTPVGLLPMAVAGTDIRSLVKGASDMSYELAESRGLSQSAYRYAVARYFYNLEGFKIEMLSSFEPQLEYFGKWWVQLFAETEGKDGKGLFPVSAQFSEELHAVGQFLQEGSPVILETFVHVRQQEQGPAIPEEHRVKDGFDYLNGKTFGEINEEAYKATLKAHMEKMPCIVLDMEKIDPYGFGQLFYFFMYSCYLSAKLLDVNPFNQDGVEAYKKRMFKALGREDTKEG